MSLRGVPSGGAGRHDIRAENAGRMSGLAQGNRMWLFERDMPGCAIGTMPPADPAVAIDWAVREPIDHHRAFGVTAFNYCPDA